jgi:hypothetical protein
LLSKLLNSATAALPPVGCDRLGAGQWELVYLSGKGGKPLFKPGTVRYGPFGIPSTPLDLF